MSDYSDEDLRIVAEKWRDAHANAHSEADMREMSAGVLRLLDELARTRPIYKLVCDLQDADQCEGHFTGDDCAQGEVEHQLFQKLSEVRIDQPSDRTDPVERGEKKRGDAVPSKKQHILNGYEECVSWCPACAENRARGLAADGKPSSRCDSCDPSFGCFAGSAPCCKVPR